MSNWFNNRYHCDPSGTFVQYEAKAIGAASEGAQNSLKEHLLVESTDENGKPKFERKVSKFKKIVNYWSCY